MFLSLLSHFWFLPSPGSYGRSLHRGWVDHVSLALFLDAHLLTLRTSFHPLVDSYLCMILRPLLTDAASALLLCDSKVSLRMLALLVSLVQSFGFGRLFPPWPSVCHSGPFVALWLSLVQSLLSPFARLWTLVNSVLYGNLFTTPVLLSHFGCLCHHSGPLVALWSSLVFGPFFTLCSSLDFGQLGSPMEI